MVINQSIDWVNNWAGLCASDLGLRPGEWPLTLEVKKECNSHTLMRRKFFMDREGDVTSVEYNDVVSGLHANVYND